MISPALFFMPIVALMVLIDGWQHRGVVKIVLSIVLLIASVLLLVLPVLLKGYMIGCIDPLSQLSYLLLMGFTVLILNHRYESIQFPLLLLFALIGGMLLVDTKHYLGFYLGVELMTIPSYILISTAKGQASEAGLKYFVMGVVASILMLYGISFLYMGTESLHYTLIGASPSIYSVLGSVLLLSGIFFKLGLVPFHSWVPDVYEAALNGVVYWLSLVPKIAITAALIRLLVLTKLFLLPVIANLFAFVGLLSIVVGALMAMRQTHLRRLLAYASMVHMGLMVLPMMTGDFAVSFVYLLGYALMTYVLFDLVLSLEHQGVTHLDSLQGWYYRSPTEAFSLMVCMAAMVGIPPLVGFVVKFQVFYVLIRHHYYILTFLALSMLACSAYYYMGVVKKLYFKAGPVIATTSQYRTLFLSMLLLLAGIMPEGIIRYVTHVIQEIL